VDVNLLVDGSVTKLRVCQNSRVADGVGNSRAWSKRGWSADSWSQGVERSWNMLGPVVEMRRRREGIILSKKPNLSSEDEYHADCSG
jgi:hypothetical protein